MKKSKFRFLKHLLSLSFVSTVAIVSATSLTLSIGSINVSPTNIINNNETTITNPNSYPSTKEANQGPKIANQQDAAPVSVNIESSSEVNVEQNENESYVKKDVDYLTDDIYLKAYDRNNSPSNFLEGRIINPEHSNPEYSDEELKVYFTAKSSDEDAGSWSGRAMSSNRNKLNDIIEKSSEIDPFVIPDQKDLADPNLGFTNASGTFQKFGIQHVKGNSVGKKAINVINALFSVDGSYPHHTIGLSGFYRGTNKNDMIAHSDFMLQLIEGNPIAVGMHNSVSSLNSGGGFRDPTISENQNQIINVKDPSLPFSQNDLIPDELDFENNNGQPTQIKHWKMYNVYDVEPTQDGKTKIVSYSSKKQNVDGYTEETAIKDITVNKTLFNEVSPENKPLNETKPSEFIKLFEKNKKLLKFTSKYAINSTFADSSIELIANDYHGYLKVVFHPNIGVKTRHMKAWYRNWQDNAYVQVDNLDTIFRIMSLIKMKPVEIKIDGFKTDKPSTEKIVSKNDNLYDISHPQYKKEFDMYTYTIEEFKDLDAQKRNGTLRDFIYKNIKELFKNLPPDSKYDKYDISITRNVNIETNEKGQKVLKVEFGLKTFYKNGELIENNTTENIYNHIKLTGFSRGDTIVERPETGIIPIQGFNDYYPQGSILIPNDSPVVALNQQTVPLLFPNSLVYQEQSPDSPPTPSVVYDASQLHSDFLKQLFTSVVKGYIGDGKNVLTIKDIAKVSIKSFSNGNNGNEAFIEVDGIQLKRFYESASSEPVIKNKWFRFKDNKSVKFIGFKSYRPKGNEELQSNFLIELKEVSNIKASTVKKNQLLDYLNGKDPNNPNVSPISNLPPKEDLNLNFNFNNDKSYGEIISAVVSNTNDIEGTIAISSFNVVNVFDKSTLNPNEFVFYNDPNQPRTIVTKPEVPLVIRGFWAENQNTQILQDSPEEGWGMLASDVRDNEEKKYIFIKKFYELNVKYPATSGTFNDLSIVEFIDVDNTKGLLKCKMKFVKALVNGQETEITKTVTLYDFLIQNPTQFVERDENGESVLSIKAPPNIDIYSFKEPDIIRTITQPENITKWIKNPPPNLTENDIILEETPTYDFVNKKIIFKFSIKKYYDNKGILVEPKVDKPGEVKPLTSQYEYEITDFNVKSPTKPGYRYEYEIPNLTETIINKEYFKTPNNFAELRQYVYDSLLAEKQKNKLSLPEIDNTNQSFEIKWDDKTLGDHEKQEYLYASGEINLVITLKKYIDNTGKDVVAGVDPGVEPINIYVKLTGWKKLNTSFKDQIVFNWGADIPLSEANDKKIKELIWNHRNELLIDALFFEEAEKQFFMTNTSLILKEPYEQNGVISLEVDVGLAEYFENGRYVKKEIAGLSKKIIITGFKKDQLITKFVTQGPISVLPEYPMLQNELPSNLAKEGAIIPNKFKEFIISKLLTGYNNISTNDILEVKFGNPNNTAGTIEVTYLRIMGYNGDLKKVELSTDNIPNYSITIEGLKTIANTELKLKDGKVNIINESKFKDITQVFQNPNLLLNFIKQKANDIFINLPNGPDSIKSISVLLAGYDDHGSQIIRDELTNKDADYTDPTNTYYGKLNIMIELSSYVEGGELVDETGPTKWFGNGQEITIYGFNKMEQTKVPGTITAKIFQNKFDQQYNVNIFWEDVIDLNWFEIQKELIKVINENFQNEPNKWTNLLPIKRVIDAGGKTKFEICYVDKKKTVNVQHNNQTHTIEIYSDENSPWDFLASDKRQAEAKERFFKSAVEAYEQPNFNNNASLGRITLPVKLIKGYNKNGTYKDFRSDEELTILIRTTGLKSTRQNAEKREWWYLWAVIGGSIGTLTFIIFIVLIVIAIKKRKANYL